MANVDTNFQEQVDLALADYEVWADTAGNQGIEKFIVDCSIDSKVAEQLRQTFRLEVRLREMASQEVAPAASLDSGVPSALATTEHGEYRFVRRLGMGGMGTVWLAEQTKPVQRSVAVKLIRFGLDSTAVARRFEAERKALAIMSHPHIAKILDAGELTGGRPFFVMEYFSGIPITDYCRNKCLPIEARLELVLQLCQAIQHAHQKGLLHRDIKPTNVLVGDVNARPHLKVIDFGLAKVLSNDTSWHPQLTKAGSPVGSPLWMSPEQTRGGRGKNDVDTRTDIYSIGVILYELLTQTTPITKEDFQEMTPTEVISSIQENDPPYPSQRLLSPSGMVIGLRQRGLRRFRVGWAISTRILTGLR